MFFLSKLLNLVAQPLNGVLLLLIMAWYFGSTRPRAARRLVASSLVLLALSGVTTLPDALITQLEGQFAELDDHADLSGYAGIVVLGGALTSGRISVHHHQSQLNASAERMTAAFSLWRRNPALKVIFTGGEGELLGSGPSEAERTRSLFESLGLPSEVLTLEDRSRNTYENALFTKELPGVDPRKRWLLVTSAYHMPRSMRTFEKTGWNVTAYPVDFRTGGVTPLTSYSLRDGAEQWELLLHEYLGIAMYRLTGRI
jgi:uncharacterized SAM-binding protein YcdF (DUF218 family)